MNNPGTYIPVITFLLGWGSGVITAWTMYRDHDRRLINAEALISTLSSAVSQVVKDVAVLYQRLRDKEGNEHA